MNGEIYCKAPWTSVSCMPGGKFAPCCAWDGQYFNSIEEMIQEVGGQFLRNQIPKECTHPCPPDRVGWRDQFKFFDTDYQQHQINFLDFRNNNLCNLKCRSCSPNFSTSWASEARENTINAFEPDTVRGLDLAHCKKVYFAGGEPLLNPQHYAVLQKLIDSNLDPVLMYSTNLTVLQYKDQHVQDLWKHFKEIWIHASIDAVGIHADTVRSGSNWASIEENLSWLRTLPNVKIRIATVVSAINIWWLQELFDYFNWLDVDHFEPVIANSNSVLSISVIPEQYRGPLIEMLEQSRFATCYNIKNAIELLHTRHDESQYWYKFLTQQLILDNYRNQHWFDHLPIKHNVYTKALING